MTSDEATSEKEEEETTTERTEEEELKTVSTALREGGDRTEDATGQFADVKLTSILTGDLNPRGIPFVLFIDSVEGLLDATPGATIESLIGAFNELHQKFKLLEAHKNKTKVQMKAKIPEITRTLELVRYLKEQEAKDGELTTHYSLSETLYARAKVKPSGSVCLWLGANVMIEYPYAQAIDILEMSLKNAKERLNICNTDADHLRDQIITVEVNMARVFNFDVKRRRDLAANNTTAAAKSSQPGLEGGGGSSSSSGGGGNNKSLGPPPATAS